MQLDLANKRVLVTGASKGIGEAVALSMAAEGAELVLVARSEAGLENVADAIRQRFGTPVSTIAIDLAGQGAARTVRDRAGEIDILVNNAGAIPRGRIDEIDEPTWRAAWDLKVFGYINMCREFYALMKARRSGVIVNVIGAAGERPSADYICGSAGNAAIMAFTRALGGQSHRDGVRVVGLNPGPVLTDRLKGINERLAMERFGDPTRVKELYARMPFGRPAHPEEISAAVAFLASPRSSYTSGTILTIDGSGTHY